MSDSLHTRLGQLRRQQQREPDNVAVLQQLAQALFQAGRKSACLEALGDLYRRVGQDPDQVRQIGAFCLRAEYYPEAADYYRKCLELRPDDNQAHNDLATILQKHGRFREAERHFRAAIAPPDPVPGALLGLANSRKFSEDDRDLVTRIAGTTHGNPMVGVCRDFALGKIYTDLKDYPAAFAAYASGNRTQKKQLPAYPWPSLQNLVETARSLTTRFGAVPKPATDRVRQPVFVVGMPRTGTTLLEQQLSDRFGLKALGERDLIQDCFRQLQSWQGQGETVTGAHLQRLQDGYLAAAGVPTAGGFVDKNPLNFLFAGIIRLIFPHALILHCRRDPFDTLLSNWFQLFGRPELAYSFDLDDCARFYRFYKGAMVDWQPLLAPPVLTVDYEDLVARTDEVLTALPLRRLEADREPETGAIHTASLWQARQPVYRDSLQRWRRHKADLGDFIDRYHEEFYGQGGSGTGSTD